MAGILRLRTGRYIRETRRTACGKTRMSSRLARMALRIGIDVGGTFTDVVLADGAGGLLVGGTEPECDPLEWVDNPDTVSMAPTQAVFQAQVTRAARRLPDLGVPGSPSGIVGVYDVSSDWSPIYDKTDVPGFYLAAGTSGNQFKNAPVIGQVMRALIEAVEDGHDHDEHPVAFTGPRTGLTVNLGAFSRKRERNPDSSGTVMG